MRAIAEAAGVSPALIIHHFGSKEGLRKACDDYIAAEIRSDEAVIKAYLGEPEDEELPPEVAADLPELGVN